MSDSLICPHCGQAITITEALQKQLEGRIAAKYQHQLAVQQQQTQAKLVAIEKRESALIKERELLEDEINKRTEAQRNKLRQELWEKAQKAAADKLSLEMKDMQEQLKEKESLQQEFERREIEIRKERREIEERQKKFALELERSMDEERTKIIKQTEKELGEQMRLKLMEKEKQLVDTQKALEAAQRKALQGSQQNQGEVLELDLEQSLREAFTDDLVQPVGKGVVGADVVQTVRHRDGKSCGVILWEIKQTKHFTEKWVGKLKDDLRAQKANIPVLVTTALPEAIQSFGWYQGLWVTAPAYAIPLAVALRRNLITTAFERAVAVGKGEKMELLYQYVSSHEFRQRVEAVVEVFAEMKEQLGKEQIAFARIWKQREGQLTRLYVNTAGMYGEMQGLVGSVLPEIKGLELEAGQTKNPDKTLSLFA